MKSYCSFIVLFTFFLRAVYSDVSIDEEGNRAKSLAQVRDFSGADQIYESLSKRSLPDWQHALILYNWGTVKLLQQEWGHSLELFSQVPLSSISTPTLLHSLAINKGFAFLGQAKLLATLPSQDFEEQIYLVRQSQISLQEAFKIDCRIQQLESPGSSECRPFFDRTALMDQTLYQIRLIRRQQRNQFLSTAQPGEVKKILIEGLNKVLLLLRRLNDKNQDYFKLINAQASTLMNLWERLAVLEDTSREEVEKAEMKYKEALAFLEKLDLEAATENFDSVVKALEPLFPLSPFATLLLHYQLVLMQEIVPLRVSDLLGELQKLQLEQKEAEKAASYLNLSLAEKKPFLSRFYLLMSLVYLKENEAVMQSSQTPLSILKQAFQNAKILENLTQLASLEKDPSLLTLLKFQQDNVLKKAAPFIEAVLLQEKEKLTQSKIECQKTPWDQVIPLFEKGLAAANQAQRWAAINPFPYFAILKEQKTTVENWDQALQLLERPPSPSPQNQSQHEEENPSASSDINETIRQIQEMQAQDKPEQEGGEEVQEGHTW